MFGPSDLALGPLVFAGFDPFFVLGTICGLGLSGVNRVDMKDNLMVESLAKHIKVKPKISLTEDQLKDLML